MGEHEDTRGEKMQGQDFQALEKGGRLFATVREDGVCPQGGVSAVRVQHPVGGSLEGDLGEGQSGQKAQHP